MKQIKCTIPTEPFWIITPEDILGVHNKIVKYNTLNELFLNPIPDNDTIASITADNLLYRYQSESLLEPRDIDIIKPKIISMDKPGRWIKIHHILIDDDTLSTITTFSSKKITELFENIHLSSVQSQQIKIDSHVYYISKYGSDTNNGTINDPLLTCNNIDVNEDNITIYLLNGVDAGKIITKHNITVKGNGIIDILHKNESDSKLIFKGDSSISFNVNLEIDYSSHTQEISFDNSAFILNINNTKEKKYDISLFIQNSQVIEINSLTTFGLCNVVIHKLFNSELISGLNFPDDSCDLIWVNNVSSDNLITGKINVGLNHVGWFNFIVNTSCGYELYRNNKSELIVDKSTHENMILCNQYSVCDLNNILIKSIGQIRPENKNILFPGYSFFDHRLNCNVIWNGDQWVDSNGLSV